MLNKVYYYSLSEVLGDDDLPYFVDTLVAIASDLSLNTTKPIDLSNANVEKLWQEVYARFYNEAIIKKSVLCYEDDPTISTADKQKWLLRFISILSRTYDYYNTLLTSYSTSASSLMADVTATSVNTIKYNETPQNEDTSGEYEGDNHLTNFTKTQGENSSPMNTKIMRLKEIQDHYKRVLDDWAEEFHQIFYEQEV